MIKFSQTEDTLMEDMKVPNASYWSLQDFGVIKFATCV